MKKTPPGFSAAKMTRVEADHVEVQAGQVQVVVVLRGPDDVHRTGLGHVFRRHADLADVGEVRVGGDAVGGAAHVAGGVRKGRNRFRHVAAAGGRLRPTGAG